MYFSPKMAEVLESPPFPLVLFVSQCIKQLSAGKLSTNVSVCIVTSPLLHKTGAAMTHSDLSIHIFPSLYIAESSIIKK